MATATTQVGAARTPPGGPASPLQPRGFVTSRDGTRIAYEASGSGPPLILVMGALGTKDISFTRQYAKEFARDFTVVNYDRRGRGGSADTKPYAVQREIEDLEALVRASGGNPFVFGLSSGAALALEAAAAGVPMAGLCAYEPPYQVGEHSNPRLVNFQERLEELVAKGERDEAVKYFMRTVGVPAFVLAIMRLFPFWRQFRAVAHTLPYDAAVMDRFEVPRQRFEKVRVPTLLATGSKSPKSLQDATKAVAAVVPGSTFRLLPKQNHGVKPKAIGPVLVEAFRGPK